MLLPVCTGLLRPPVSATETERKNGRDVGGLQEMEGGAREERQVKSREAMIANQHVAGNYNVVFLLSCSIFSLPLPAIHTFLSYKLVCSRLMGSWRRLAK